MPLDPARIRALLFDIDGTLCDTDDLYVLRLARGLGPWQRLLLGQDPLRMARRLIMHLESPVNRLYEWADKLYLDEAIKFFCRRLQRKEKSPGPFQVIPGIEIMLRNLQTHYPLAVVSSRGERGARAFLNQFGMADFFQVIVTAHTCNKTKPHPEPLYQAARQLQIDPTDCVMIGDTTVDIRAGKAAGCQTVGVLCGFGEKKELLKAGADLIIDMTTDLTEILLEQKHAVR